MKKYLFVIFVLIVSCQKKSIEFENEFDSSSTLVDTTKT